MEKNIKKRECRLALVLIAMLVVVFGYWFFFSPHGYLQKQKEADWEEYSERRLLWRKSETMTMQQMLQDLTLLANGDSVMVCEACYLTFPVYRAFIHGTAQPRRLAWANLRHWYVSYIVDGKEYMEQMARQRTYKATVFWLKQRTGVQEDSTKDYRKEKLTSTENTYNKMYPKLGKAAEREFEEWRDGKNKRWVRLWGM